MRCTVNCSPMRPGRERSLVLLRDAQSCAHVVPSHEDGLRQTFADTHRRYTG